MPSNVKNICPELENNLVDLLNGRPSSADTSSSSSWHTSTHTSHVRHSIWHSSCILVQLGDDGVAYTFNLFLLVLEFINLGKLVSIEPLDGFVALISDGLHVILGYLVLYLLIIKCSLHVEAVAFQLVLSGDSVLLLVILSLELLRIIHHPLDLFLGQTTLVIGDGNLVLLASTLVSSRHIQDTIGIDVKGDFDQRNSSGCWWNTSEVKLAKVVIILGHGSLALVNLDGHGWLVVRVGGECLGLLSGDSGVPLDEAGHHSSCCLNTKGQRSHVQQEQVRHLLTGISCQDSSLNSSTVGYSLVRVDRPVQLLAVEEVLEQFLNLGNSGRTSDKNDVVNGTFVHLGIPHCLLHWFQGSLEEV